MEILTWLEMYTERWLSSMDWYTANHLLLDGSCSLFFVPEVHFILVNITHEK